MTTLAQHRGAVDAARQTLNDGRRALLDADGRRLYSDHEHARREQALRDTFRATIADAAEAAHQAINEADVELGRSDADPVHRLSTGELERASLLRSLLRERMLTAPIRDVDAEVEAVLRDGDRAARYATWSLVTERRQVRVHAAIDAAPDLTGRLRAQHGPEAGPLASMAERLVGTLVDTQARSAARERAEERRSEALGVTAAAGVNEYLELEYGPRPTATVPVGGA